MFWLRNKKVIFLIRTLTKALNNFQKDKSLILSHNKTKVKSATREAQLVTIGIPTNSPYSFEQYLTSLFDLRYNKKNPSRQEMLAVLSYVQLLDKYIWKSVSQVALFAYSSSCETPHTNIIYL